MILVYVLMSVDMNIIIFWYVTACNQVITHVSEERSASVFRVEE